MNDEFEENESDARSAWIRMVDGEYGSCKANWVRKGFKQTTAVPTNGKQLLQQRRICQSQFKKIKKEAT